MSKKSTTKASSVKKILIVDDHPITRQGLAQLINFEPDLTVCAEAENARQAQNWIEKTLPDLVLLDITLPDKNGLDLIKDLKALHTNLPILAISMHDEAFYAERVIRAGGRGYIMKQEGGKRIMDGIRTVLAGQVFVSEKMTSRILENMTGAGSRMGGSPIHQLTDREFEVFELVGQGKTTRQIAQQLNVSIKTIEAHRLNIKSKLDLKNNAELINQATRWVTSA